MQNAKNSGRHQFRCQVQVQFGSAAAAAVDNSIESIKFDALFLLLILKIHPNDAPTEPSPCLFWQLFDGLLISFT